MIVGIDEVGRGCWAGPVVAGAVLLDDANPIVGLKDSKKLSKIQRQKLSDKVKTQALAIGLGWVWMDEVDHIGLTAAVGLAMRRALEAIELPYDAVIIDGNYNFLPDIAQVSTLVRADDLVPAVSAASIIAKVARDTWMATEGARQFPQYGFERHVGYGTAAHAAALKMHGVCALHRLSFRPVRAIFDAHDHL